MLCELTSDIDLFSGVLTIIFEIPPAVLVVVITEVSVIPPGVLSIVIAPVVVPVPVVIVPLPVVVAVPGVVVVVLPVVVPVPVMVVLLPVVVAVPGMVVVVLPIGVPVPVVVVLLPVVVAVPGVVVVVLPVGVPVPVMVVLPPVVVPVPAVVVLLPATLPVAVPATALFLCFVFSTPTSAEVLADLVFSSTSKTTVPFFCLAFFASGTCFVFITSLSFSCVFAEPAALGRVAALELSGVICETSLLEFCSVGFVFNKISGLSLFVVV